MIKQYFFMILNGSKKIIGDGLNLELKNHNYYTSNMKISIITAIWNSNKTLRDTFDSVLKQDYKVNI